jgi:bacillithiol synthase
VSPVRVVDTPLEGGALASAALKGIAPTAWYAKPPASAAEWKVHCRRVASESGDWLASIRPAFGAGASLLDRVAGGQGVVVTTGQQAGLFGGPMYTWFKALAVLEFAAAIERETGIPAAPVFWAATDDADFAEAASMVIAGANGAERLSLSERPGDGVPMSHATLGAEVDALFARLAPNAALVSDDRALHAAANFKPGVTIGAAYIEMLRAVLEPLGMAVLDASHAAVGAAARSTLASALSKAAAIHEALIVRQSEFRAANFPVPVEVDRPLSLVFAWESANGGLPRKRRITMEQAASGISNEVRLSPNVLLRPVLERQLLPTAAYLAGPGEIAYFGQVSAVADAMKVARPLALPRWSGMVIPRDIDNALKRLKLEPEALRDPHGAEGNLARAALPLAATKALDALRVSIRGQVAALDGLLGAATLDGARDQLLRRADRLERRLLAAMKHREAESMRDVASARAVLYPFGKPQERALNIIPLWSRHGEELIAGIRAACAAHARRLIEGAAV